MSKGYVYVLINSAMPGYVKIGRTIGDPAARAAQLFSTGVPVPFDVAASFLAPDCVSLEAECHKRLDKYRVDTGREFFSVPLNDAVQVIEDAHREQIEEWLGEFLNDHGAFRYDEVPDCSSIACQAYHYEIPYVQVIDAISGITIDELMPSLRRLGYVDHLKDVGEVQ